jgi:hypothetical protein
VTGPGGSGGPAGAGEAALPRARINELLDVSHDYSAAGADRGLPVGWELRDA